MAAEKLKKARKLADTKSRVILVLIIVLIVVGAAIGYFGYKKRQQSTTVPSGAEVQRAPSSIQSIPGVGQTTQEYAQQVEQSNIQQAQRAAKTGTSAVPTLVRAAYQGPTDFDFSGGGGKKDCSVTALRRARESGVKASELRCAGCSAQQLLAAGYTPGGLADAGFGANALQQTGASPTALRQAGYSAAELRRAGYSCQRLLKAGYSAKEIAQAGYSQAQLKQCLSKDQLAAIQGKPSDLPASFPKDCSAASLKKAREQGISAKKIREQLGCNAAEFKKGGYSAKQLKDAGFTAGDLKRAGYSAKQLKDAGYTPEQLRQAGFSADEAKDAGIGREQAAQAGYSEGDLTRAGYAKPKPEAKPAPPAKPTAKKPAVPTETAKQAAAAPSGPKSGASVPSVSAPGSDAELLEKLRKQQAHALSEQQRQNLMQQLEQAMLTQSNDLVSAWGPPTPQQFTQAPEKAATDVAGGAGSASGGLAGGKAAAKGPVVKAGSIMFAVLDTGVNSDEESPVMATIVQGKLKGAKLLGRFSRVNKKVVLSFSLMSVPSLNRSLSLNAVAIDPETARTALASRVNSHYLLRYGTLFASAFLSGLGSAIQQSGSTSVNSGSGSVSTAYKNLDKTELTLAALGNVGQEYSNRLGQNFERAPTVYVKSGMGIGILFMQDLTLPKAINLHKGSAGTPTAQQVGFNKLGGISMPQK